MPAVRKKENPLPLMERLLLSTEDAANLLDLSHHTMREMVNEGVLPSVKVREIIRVPRKALEKWIDDNTRMARRNVSPEEQLRAAMERAESELAKALETAKEESE